MPRLRMSMRGAILASVLVHALVLAGFIEVSRERQSGLMAPVERTEQPPVEVEILADPRAGAPDGDDMAADQTEHQPTEPMPEQATTPTAPTDTPRDVQPPEIPPREQAEAPAAVPPSPSQPEPPPQPPTAEPPRTAAAPPARATPPTRPRAGSGGSGRADGTTDIVLGENTVPPGPDSSHYNVPPRFPPEAIRRGQQGMVRLNVLVATDGAALSVEVAQSSGYPLLDRAARDAVARWRFRPGQDGGIAVPSTIPVTLSFILDERR